MFWDYFNSLIQGDDSHLVISLNLSTQFAGFSFDTLCHIQSHTLFPFSGPIPQNFHLETLFLCFLFLTSGCFPDNIWMKSISIPAINLRFYSDHTTVYP